MTTFDKREQAFENQFAHDQAVQFKATARRNSLLGLWAAEKLGLAGTEANSYAQEIVILSVQAAGDDDVFAKIRRDFDAKNVVLSDHQIQRKMSELMAQAVIEVRTRG